MLAKAITFTDYNGVERTQTFYFNLTKAELSLMQIKTAGGFAEKIQSIVEAKNEVELANLFTDIIHKSYAVKSDDGLRLIKSDELSTAFEQTEAYSELIMELLTKEGAASDFINGIIPKMDTNVPAPALK